jgi:hypothetical protein
MGTQVRRRYVTVCSDAHTLCVHACCAMNLLVRGRVAYGDTVYSVAYAAAVL